MKKKQVLSLMLASMMVVSMAACGGSKDDAKTDDGAKTEDADEEKTEDAGDEKKEEASGEKQKITWTFRHDGNDLNKNALYNWVNSTYENWDKKDQVELDIAPITASEGDYFTKIALQLADPGTCPDLVCEDTFQLPNDVVAGYLTNLDEYVADYEDWNNGSYIEALKKGVTSDDGSVYGIPYCTDSRGLWYNRSIMEKAGVIGAGEDWEPKNWDEILDACAKIKENCPDVVPYWSNTGVACGEGTSMQTYEMLLYGTGERLITDDGKWIVESEGILKSLNFINDIYSNGYGPSLSLVLNGNSGTTACQEYMPNDKLGMMLDGNWACGNWKETGAAPLADYDKKLGFAAMPTSEGQDPGTVTLAGGWGFSIPENSDAKDITFEFITELMKPENYLPSIIAQGNLATRADVAEMEEYKSEPFLKVATDFLEKADFRPQNDQYSTVSTSIPQMVEAVASGTSPEDAMKQFGIEVARNVGDENVTTK